MKFFLSLTLMVTSSVLLAQTNPKLINAIDVESKAIESKVIEWRRHFHQFPELSNREYKTGARIAGFLEKLGLEIKYPVAKTGVVAILRTGKPGPVIALRADIDALPILEANNVVELRSALSTRLAFGTAGLRGAWHR